ncbi:hypothetical protein [Denitromonas sp.]|nr:hypothetical protein [Denitromonas sp.]
MKSFCRTLVLAAALAAAPVHAQEAGSVTGDKATDMAVDLVVVRPLGFVGAVIGTVGFVLALPFTVPSGSVGETAEAWIGEPLEYTFNRPLGNFDQCGADRHPCGN